jgi:hypothetical protein
VKIHHWNRRSRRAAGRGSKARYQWLCDQHVERLFRFALVYRRSIK